MHAIPHHSRLRRGSVVLLLLALAACSRDRGRPSDSGELSARERAAFAAPADSALTVEQVDQYLRTSVAQFELLRAEAPAMRERLAAARQERAQQPPASSPRGARRKTPQALWGDFVDGTFVRAARELGYRPAELLYVRGRVAAAGGQLLATGMHASRDQAAALFRQQADAMRGAPGVSQQQIDAMLRAADQAERQAAAPVRAKVSQNLDVLRRARGVPDATWGRIAAVAGGAETGELGTLPQTEAEARLDQLRVLYLGALKSPRPR